MATYYFGPGGNDSTGNGTVGTPWLSISKAVGSSTTSDTLIALSGTHDYSGGGYFLFNPSTRTISGQDGTTFDWGLTNPMIIYCTGSAVFHNITFYRGYTNNVYHAMYEPVTVGSTIEFDNCIFKDHKLHAGSTYYGGLFAHCANGQTVTINSCKIYGCYGIAGGGNILWSAYTGYTYVYNTSIHIPTNANPLLHLWGCTTADHLVVRNVIAVNGNGGTCTYLEVSSAGVDEEYCCFYNFTSPPTGTGVITSDPLLVDPINGNFKLRPSSPCIGTGTIL